MTMAVEHLWRVPFEAEPNASSWEGDSCEVTCFPLLGMWAGSYVIKGPHYLGTLHLPRPDSASWEAWSPTSSLRFFGRP